MSEDPRYGAFTLRTECNHCGNPLPLHGPLLRVRCPSCLEDAEIPPELYRDACEDFEANVDGSGDAPSAARVELPGGLTAHREFRKKRPACEKCGATFAIEEIGVGARMNFACTHCGDPASTEPAPEWLRRLVPTVRQFYSTEPAAEAPSALSAKLDRAIKPVVMTCPACGGSLTASTQSERVMECKFCKADVYLPDEVWRRLHPVVKVREWFLRFEGKTPHQLERQRLSERAAERRRHKAEAKRRRRARAAQEEERRKAAEEEEARLLDREVRRLKRGAYVAALLFVTSLVSVGAYTWHGLASDAAFTAGDGIYAGLGLSGMLLVVALALAGAPLSRATGYGGDWLLFATWFWVPFALFMPGIGQLFALVRAGILAVGHFGGSSIKSNGSTRSYSAVTLTRGEGRPAALIFLTLATVYPLTMAAVLAPTDARGYAVKAGLFEAPLQPMKPNPVPSGPVTQATRDAGIDAEVRPPERPTPHRRRRHRRRSRAHR